MNNCKFQTARGSIIDLEFPAKWHTIMPAVESLSLTSLISSDDRFEYLATDFKIIGGYKIEYCKVRITDKHTYLQEKELHQKYANKICYLTIVTSNNEPILDGDLEANLLQRAVIIPEKIHEKMN